MDEQDSKAFSEMYESLSTAFGKETSKPRLSLYFLALSDLRFEAVAFAVKEIILKEEQFPVVAKIREYARSWRPPVQRRVVDDAHLIEEVIVPDEEAKAMLQKLKEKLGLKNIGKVV